MKNETGIFGENAAADFLRRRGYAIIARNFMTKIGEIDIIARKNNTFVFVEVKTLNTVSGFIPEMHFTPDKLHKMQRTALLYCKQNRISPECSMRFDLIAVDRGENGTARDIRHYENLGE